MEGYASEKRPWQIYADFAQVLIGTARSLYLHDDLAVELDQTVYALGRPEVRNLL